jgi:hypothetical protein
MMMMMMMISLAALVARFGDRRGPYRVLVRKLEGKGSAWKT